MTLHENTAALAREKAARKAAYFAAIAERDVLPGDTDHHTRHRAEGRVALALDAMRFWGDPIPAAPAAVQVTPAVDAFVGPSAGVKPAPARHPASQSEADRLADEIIAAANAAEREMSEAFAPPPQSEADRLAAEIVTAARLVEP